MNTDFLFLGGCFLPNLEAASAFIQKKPETRNNQCSLQCVKYVEELCQR